MPRTAWRWLNNDALVVDEGRRPVVIMGRDLREYRSADGRSVPLDPEGRTAKALASVPELLDLLEDGVSLMPESETEIGLRGLWVAKVRKIIEEIDRAT